MTKGHVHAAKTTALPRRLTFKLVEKEGRSSARFSGPPGHKHSDAVTQLKSRGTGITAFRRALDEAESPRTASAFHKRSPFRRLTMVCAWCKKVRDSEGSWQRTQGDLQTDDHDVNVSHGICFECAGKSYSAYRLATASTSLRFGT